MNKETAQWLALVVWGVLSVALLAVVFIISRQYNDEEIIDQIFDWFTPTVLPILGLMFGAAVKNPFTRRDDDKEAMPQPTIKIKFVALILVTLVIYFIFIIAVLSGGLFGKDQSAIEFIQSITPYSKWLAVGQGILAGLLAALFSGSEKAG